MFKIINDNSLNMLNYIEPNTIDSVITDPPYGLTSNNGDTKGFMGKEWDGSGIEYNVDLWSKVLTVLKPGGYLLAFGGSRTFYRIACAIEDAGFEIRDTIMWLYGSGFPKSTNIGLAIDKKNGVESIDTGVSSPNARPNSTKDNTLYESGTVGKDFTIKHANNEWDGWGTCLKPAFEPIIVARKPLEGTLINNVQKYHVGGLNIDECKVPFGTENDTRIGTDAANTSHCGFLSKDKNNGKTQMYKNDGRFPSNVILTYDDSDFDEVCGHMPVNASNGGATTMPAFCESGGSKLSFGQNEKPLSRLESDYIAPNDYGSVARYFYCAKASQKDRDEGLDNLETKLFHRMRPDKDHPTGLNTEGRFAPVPRKNIHPTVKPTELMQYLIKLVTPPNGIILDPFNGSGSTGKAAAYENIEHNKNYSYIGIELDPEYCNISENRIKYILENKEIQTKLF